MRDVAGAVLVIAALVLAALACGMLEGPDLADHAEWMAGVKEQGAVVLW